MTSRKRKNTTRSSDLTRSTRRGNSQSGSKRSRSGRKGSLNNARRRHLLETLETRQLLAGPQLIGIQPNEGALIVDGTQRDTAPRLLTFGFDEAQQLDPSTTDGIRITRSGLDGVFNTADDVPIDSALVTLGDPNENEVVVRFVETLPDDNYRVEIFGYDDEGQGIVGLKNLDGEFFAPSELGERSDVIDFELKLGALVEAVVPQPVFRDPADPQKLIRNDNEIVVYFNEDALFVEDDASGNPTARSAENPRFYQLLFTNETVGTFDDERFAPDEVVYDAATHTARLIFSGDINELPDRQPGDGPSTGGTWRLRIGSAVDVDMDLLIAPTPFLVQSTAVTDFQQPGLRVAFKSNVANGTGEGTGDFSVRFIDSGTGGVTASIDGNGDVVFDFGGVGPTAQNPSSPTVSDLRNAVANNPTVANLLEIEADFNGDINAANGMLVPQSVVNSQALALVAVGDTHSTSLDVGIFGQFNDLSSIVLSEAISAQPYAIELAGGQGDPGHTDEVQHINQDFGADTLDGITEIAYNFNPVFDNDGTNDFLNQITDRQKTRIREALNLWSSKVGVQFRETVSDGITFALGDTADLQNRGAILAQDAGPLDAVVRVDPTFADSALVFSNQIVFGTAYGEDFTRKSVAGIGLLLGLNQSNDLAPQTIMSFNAAFLDQGNTSSIDSLTDLEPIFPNSVDVLHGQHVHRPDSIDVDLYRFEVDLNDADKVGTLTAETFAERLADSSLLDTSITLFEEVPASVASDFGVGPELEITVESMLPGKLGNNSRISFIQTDRPLNNLAVRILPAFDASGQQLTNAILIDLPRTPQNGTSTLTAGRIVDAINDSPFASAMFRAEVTIGSESTIVADGELNFPALVLDDGGLVRLARNDDYFGEDSRLKASLGEGIYYVGVASSGNEQYDPEITGSGFGGLTQGKYDLHLKFEPQLDEVDVIRDLDNDRVDVPGTILDGDGDGIPGGVHNFWFQTRPENRIVSFTDNGDAVTPGQTVRIVGATGVTRTFEFVPNGQTPSPGNIAVNYSPGGTGFPTPSGNLAAALQAAINNRQNETGVRVNRVDVRHLEFFGDRSVNFSTNFRGATAVGRNIFVDKSAGPQADGSLDRPFNNIANPAVANAFGSAIEGDIVRIVGNGGLDNRLETEDDNFSYKIGVSDTGGVTLEDGRNMEVPKGVTTMIDAGAIFKLRNSFIGIGSSTIQVDRSGGALQVLGTPRLVQLSDTDEPGPLTTSLISGENVAAPGYDDGSVIFTSIRDRSADLDAAGISPAPTPGNWGGLIFRRDLDQAQGRRDLEDEGIFLQRVNHAELRYGGGSGILIDSVQQLVNPVQIVNMRPTITFNEITQSADSAISAAPDSFEETSFQSPEFQQRGAFTADYDRVGPEIHGNSIVDNSINGLFIRASTTPTERPKEFTVAGRFDDIDIVHYVSENLVVAAAPGGSITDDFAPSMELVTWRELPGGGIDAGNYQYKMTFVDADGFESLASSDSGLDTLSVTVVNNDSSIELSSLLQVGVDTDYVSRRLYRSEPVSGEFRLVADLDASSRGFVDRGDFGVAALDLGRAGTRGRLDASLVMDPGLIVKLRGARIELGHGTQLLAEGLGSNPVVFTSAVDDRFGIGGTFDTNNDGITGNSSAERGDWSGIYAGPTANVSFDNVQLSYAGGISLLEGGLARGFLPLELQQATGRITNSRFEFNDDGQDGAGPAGRFGRLAVTEATIMVRGSQPIIVGNTFVDNRGSIIDIDIESMTGDYNIDLGRQTGEIDRLAVLDDNHGPAIRFNRYLNLPFDANDPGLQLSGLEVRAGVLSTETIFDDTDIAHLLFDTIEVGNMHSSGGLRLLSRPDESLVVKFSGPGGPNSAIEGTGITATGATSSTDDRVGGSVHIIGLPGSPVILTSIEDDTAGAGLKPDGSQFTDHDGDGVFTRPFANDWRGILLDQFSNDYNIPVLPELELSTEVAPGLNASVENAQLLGDLADNLSTGDHVRRLGFEVEGFLSGNNDIDTYSFVGSPGTEIWIDIDKTSLGLDTVIELLDETGAVLARSDNSADETAENNAAAVTIFDPDLQGVTTSLQAANEQYTERNDFGLYDDFGSTNTRDAGIHYRLAGNVAGDTRSVYFFRVRSASINPDDAAAGISGGNYRVQLRLTEEQQFPGSVVRYSDIRYANNGIHVQGLMASSPLLGEAQENEGAAFGAASNDTPVGLTPGSGGQYVGNLVDGTRNVISVGGALGFASDVDFYQFEVDFANTNGFQSALQSTVFDIDYADGFNRPDTNISVFYDPDGLPQFGGSGSFEPRLVFFGSSSNIADDLTSPGGENNAIEKLIRGSVSDGDPFIGPVVLPEGVYYVAVTSDGVTPNALLNAIREPINSVDRLVEDRIDRINAETRSTANVPSIPRLFEDASIVASTFSIESDTRLGHGKPNHFDGTTGTFSFGGAPPVFEFVASGTGGDAPNGVDIGNPSFPSNLDLFDFSLADDFAIGGRASFGGQAELTSTTIPHLTVVGDLQNDPADFYQFVIPTTNGQNISKRVIFDIDDGYNMLADVDDDGDPLTPPVNTDSSSVDTTLILLREDPANPGTIELVPGISSNTDSTNTQNGAGGSNSLLDPYLDTFLQPGNYFIGVLEEGTTFTIDAAGITTTNDAISGGAQDYTLHVSIEDHVLPPGSTQLGAGVDVLAFDRITNDQSGSITSEVLDLSGYVAQDLPTLYFNRLFQPVFGPGGVGDDTASLTVVVTDENGGQVETLLHNFVTDNDPNSTLITDDWKQLRLSLGEFAGESDVRLRVDYTTNGLIADSSPQSRERGLLMDDFIVGFAERGETVFNASSNARFGGSGTGAVSGEYQLELRHGSDFASPTFDINGDPVTQLDVSFDTNARHNRSVTLIAPDGSQISDGQTFVIGDGASNQTFEFKSSGNATFGNTTIPFSATDSSAEVARKIRNAINSQTAIKIEAASAGGLDTEDPTDGQLALSGNATGTFSTDPSTDLTVDSQGHLQIPAVLHDGLGDENFLRTQGQVIVENNVIRDVRGIGIWSEPGLRQVDPRHDVNNIFLDTLHLGNSSPGSVRNLPTLNDSVLGGLAPGIVIQNNSIDQAEYAGIKIDGEIAPLAIVPPDGDSITDGSTFAIDAAGTRVVFEFEDIGQGVIPPNYVRPYGSATDGGDGVRDGHVPVYIRHTDSNAASPYVGRTTVYTPVEVANAIRESIQGSILMSNALVELVDVEIGPWLASAASGSGLDFIQPAVYVFGASGIYTNAEIQISQTPISEAPQPFARIVNNTIYGDDGRESNFPESAQSEPSDLLSQAIDTKVGSSHRGPYIQTGAIGDNAAQAQSDVDFYQVYLEVGDRLVVDIDTVSDPNATPPAVGPDTIVKVFDASGIAQSLQNQTGSDSIVNASGVAPDHLDPLSTAYTKVSDGGNSYDPFVDFTASRTGIYYVGVSSEGNDNYDPMALSGRVQGTGGAGDYTIGLEVFAPRSFVISGNNGSGQTRLNGAEENDQDGITGEDVIGDTFTVTQISDVDLTRTGGINEITFEFVVSPNLTPFQLGNGNIAISLGNPAAAANATRLPDIMRRIEQIVNGTINNVPVIPNDTISRGPIDFGRAYSAGGPGGSSIEIPAATFSTSEGIVDNPFYYFRDFNTSGFGHRMNFGSTEQYVMLGRVANVELDQGLIDAGLALDPAPGLDIDQLINESGVVVAGGASPTLLNNVFLNLHESVVAEETRFLGFGEDNRGADQHRKPQEVIVVASAFQHDEPTPTQFNDETFFLGLRDFGLTTLRAPSNVNGGTDDFNIVLGNNDTAVQYAEAANFQPDIDSLLIDSSVSSLVERDALVNLKNSLGLPISNILTPTIDVAGILRADNPDVAPPGGIGASIFVDRGSSELADFVGPIAIAEAPRDNDADGVDADPTVGTIDLKSGVYEEFRIQLRDTGDASDPFAGIGIDDASVVVPAIPGVRPSGANVSLFENDTLLTQGIDYTFNYDETKNIITLTPLAGIWRNDRAYRISLNNQDQNVLIAADPADIRDGDQFSITDTNGGTVVFEFETGYQLLVPEPLTMIVPREGTNAGGVRDGDIFQINDGINPPVVFEYNSDTAQLPGTVVGPLPTRTTPLDPDALNAFLEEIALSTANTIIGEVTAGRLDLDVRIVGDPASEDVDVVQDRIVLGADLGATLTTSGSGLRQLARTSALSVPAAGTDPVNGVVNGDSFSINNGSTTSFFEFNDGTGAATPGAIVVDISGQAPLTSDELATAIVQAIVPSGLGLTPEIIGNQVYLNLPESGSVTVSSGRLGVVGVARPAVDGDTLTITPVGGTAADAINFEINRTDERDVNGDLINDGVAVGSIAVDVQRGTTADRFARDLAEAIIQRSANTPVNPNSIVGLDANGIRVVDGGLVVLGGEAGLGLNVTGDAIDVVGVPSVADASRIQVFGPLLLNMPTVGGGAIRSGEVLILKDQFDNNVLFEFVSSQGGVQEFDGGTNPDGSVRPLSVVVPYNTFDTDVQLATTLEGIINAQNIGLTASPGGVGQVSLGRIDQSRVSTSGDPASGVSGINQVTVLRGIVSDQEVLVIRQGTNEVRFEFEEATSGGGVTAGNVPVNFQAGSTVADVANSLAAAINNNAVNLRFTGQAVATADGEVRLFDVPGTVVDVTGAPTLNVVGVPGGARPVRISPSFSATEVKLEILNAINSINETGNFTSLVAQDRGGDTLFVRNGVSFTGAGITNYFLPAIKDLSGNPLEANRDDLTTQFSILMPESALDFGDAPDPVAGVFGRYPTLLDNDGPRHAIDGLLTLGVSIDADLDGRPSPQADGDDQVISIGTGGGSFTVTSESGVANIVINTATAINGDGDTITIDTGVDSATLELDLDGIFEEDNFAIRPQLPITTSSIAAAINAAIIESPLRPASITAVGVDEVTAADTQAGSTFSSTIVDGVLNISVNVFDSSGQVAAVDGETIRVVTDQYEETLELDFNGVTASNRIAVVPTEAISNQSISDALIRAIQGSQLSQAKIAVNGIRLDNSDSLQVITDDEDGVVFSSALNPGGVLNKGAATPIEVTVFGSGVVEAWVDFNADGDWDDPGEQIISGDTAGAIFDDPNRGGITRPFTITVPETTPVPQSSLTTYARFRVSRLGGLQPTGLSLSGEVEDYALLILPGGPPVLTGDQANRSFTVDEGGTLSALDADGSLTSTTNDDGLLNGVIDPDGDEVAIFADDVGTFTLFSGTTAAGELTVFENGTFTFSALGDFNGDVTFTARVTDVKPLDPSTQIVQNDAITATISVQPVNDIPVASGQPGFDLTVREDLANLDGLSITTTGPSFSVTTDDGIPSVAINAAAVAAVDASGAAVNDGDTITIVRGDESTTLELDFDAVLADGSFDVAEGNIAIRPQQPITTLSTIAAINAAIAGTTLLSPADMPYKLDVATLIDPFYEAGPANESEGVGEQALIFQSVSSTDNQNGLSDEGGTVEILANGTELRYTPPLNFNGIDTFTYVVADVPADGQLSQASPVVGTVSITVTPDNDDPIADVDTFPLNVGDPTPLLIGIDPNTNKSVLLNNDSPGPLQPEMGSESGQTIELLDVQTRSQEGGTVVLDPDTGVISYTPRAFFNGTDRFSYTIRDNGSPRAIGTGVVVITVGGENEAPRFVSITGPDASADGQGLVLTESKDVPLDRSFDLQTWFFDPEGDSLTFSVTSDNPSLVTVTQTNGSLDLRVPPFASGTTVIRVTASDGNGGTLTQPITVTVNGTPDPPQVNTTVDEYNGFEDQNTVIDLSSVFIDRDGDDLEYRIVSLGGIQNPSADQIANHPLIASLRGNEVNTTPADHLLIVGDRLIITPQPDQSGTVDIVLSATDGVPGQVGRQSVNYVFTANFAAVADRPVAFGDSYNVPIGSVLRVLDPADGLLRAGTNVADFDADGDMIRVDTNPFPLETTYGIVDVAENGTFTYTNRIDTPNVDVTVGLVDTFQYRILDETLLASTPVVVSLTLNRSSFQNPIGGLESDVTADGVVSPIDILRVINFLAENGNTFVSEIGTSPPDYVDVDGNGQVTPADILSVINTLADQRASAQGELISGLGSAQGELVGANSEFGGDASFGVTTAFAASDQSNLPMSNRLPLEKRAEEDESQLESSLSEQQARDVLLTSGISLSDSRLEASEEILSQNRGESGADDEVFDQVLGDLFDEISLDSLLGGN